MLRKIACNATNSAAIDFKGNVYVWGAGKYGLLGNPKQKNNNNERQEEEEEQRIARLVSNRVDKLESKRQHMEWILRRLRHMESEIRHL